MIVREVRKTFQYKVRLSKSTEANCIDQLEKCRTLYNLALEQRIMIYNQSKKSLSYYDQQYQLPSLRKDFPEFKQINAQCLCDVILRLDRAFQKFFRRKMQPTKVGFPRFKSFGRYDSFTLKQSGYKLEGRYLYLSKIGKIKLFFSRPIEGKIKEVTIKRTPTNKWFVSFSCDGVSVRQFPITNKEIGIDVGIKSFIADSDNHIIDNPKYLKNSLKKLRVKQRILSRRKKGSSNRKEARLQVAKVHEKISDQRKDFLHKTANYYIQNYKKIYIEDLQVNNMIRNRHFARSIQDSSWYKFFQLLSYKAEEAGREVIKVNPRNTSQRCSQCGEIVRKSLAERTHNCPYCGLVLDRDYNASINIKMLGQSYRTLTQDDVSPYVVRESYNLKV